MRVYRKIMEQITITGEVKNIGKARDYLVKNGYQTLGCHRMPGNKYRWKADRVQKRKEAKC